MNRIQWNYYLQEKGTEMMLADAAVTQGTILYQKPKRK